MHFRLRFGLANAINTAVWMEIYNFKCIEIEFAIPNLSLNDFCIQKSFNLNQLLKQGLITK